MGVLIFVSVCDAFILCPAAQGRWRKAHGARRALHGTPETSAATVAGYGCRQGGSQEHEKLLLLAQRAAFLSKRQLCLSVQSTCWMRIVKSL
jgi:hypothetical protein